MIDVSPLLLWPVEDVLDLLPLQTADSPQARRLAVLAAEAQAARQDLAVVGWLCDVARVLLAHVAPSRGCHALLTAVTATETVALRGQPVPSELRALLTDLCEIEAPRDLAEAAASTLAGWALSLADQTPFTPEQAWQTATELLAVVAQTAGAAVDSAIAQCAEQAHKRLFSASQQERG